MQRHLRSSLALTSLIVVAACGAGADPTDTRSVRNEPLVPTAPVIPPASPQPDGGAGEASAPDAGTTGGPGGAPTEPPTTAAPSGIFPPDSHWNTRIDEAPVDPRSEAYIAAMGADDPLVASWDAEGDGLPYVEVGKDQPTVPVHFWGFPRESDPGPYPIPWHAPTDLSTDHHVIVVDRGNGWLYELFDAARNSDGSWSASNGAKWNLRTNDRRPDRWTSADAAGMPIFPGIVRFDEVEAGWIGHALRFAVNRSQRGYVWPASHAAGQCDLGSDCPPMGLRVRLKRSVDISRFSHRMQVVLRALQQYGMFVADNTGTARSWWVAGAPDARWSDEENLTLGALKGHDFEVVEHGSIQPQ
ncbi:MAG TPA: hypothetical protein VLQ79_07950 [Myxococcaceae bacterium]|nr:hypothetical protein [Myxococcaceae bacterium]